MNESTTVSTIVSVDSTVQVNTNTTEVIFIDERGVETLTIIIWCVGGILLITLLSLLGRIVLAKKKYPLEYFDYLEHIPGRENNNHLQIRIDGRRIVAGTLFQSRDTIDLVPRCDLAVAITDTPVHRPTSNTTDEPSSETCQRQRNPTANTEDRNQHEQRQIVTRHLECGEYLTSCPQRTAQILLPDDSGSRATINGYIIRPPPYREVVSTSSRIPSVVVSRDQRESTAAGRQMFTL